MRLHFTHDTLVASITTLALAALPGCAGAQHGGNGDRPRASTESSLGPRLARADYDARLADHRLRHVEAERLEDGPRFDAPTGAPRVSVTDGVISADSCRPNGMTPALLADSAERIYVVFEESRLAPPASNEHSGPAMVPPTYCSAQRFRIPAGMTYAGVLSLE